MTAPDLTPEGIAKLRALAEKLKTPCQCRSCKVASFVIPLLDEVERLREELATWKGAHSRACGLWDKAWPARDAALARVTELKAENARLRAVLERVANMGANGISEEGCPSCLGFQGYDPIRAAATHLPGCFIAAALAVKP